jgi:wobble nucleotide-excising tRNase
MAQLAEHFGEEDQHLKEDIESAQAVIGKAQEELVRLQAPPKSAFYAELRDEVENAVAEFDRSRSGLADTLANVRAALDHKLSYRATSYAVNITIDLGGFQSSFDAVTNLIAKHNDKTERFSDQKAQSRSALEEHYLSTIKDQVVELETQIAERNAVVAKLTNGADDLDDKRSLEDISKSILEKQAKVLNAHAGGEELTALLKKFLGRTDLTLESGPDGYRVMRRGKPAKRLSEGEKTAIAFLYFIVQLSDQDFDITDGIVVIDDPISSLDSSSIYQAFSFLKNAVKDARQVVLLTHNFEFLRLILNWFHNIKKAVGSKAYYMIVCTESALAREACLVKLDHLLQEHATEYNYLFKILYNYKSDGTIASCYHIPNVARKVLETFLEFYSPGKGSVYDKLEATAFDSHKKTAVYKFANDLSHPTGKGFDPALVAETQKNTEYLLEMIKLLAPVHYDALERLSA